MNDLISRKAMLEEFRSICGPVTGDGWDNFGVRDLIMRQPTVDAIPVEWLQEKLEDMIDAVQDAPARAIGYVLLMWQKEKEGRR